MTGARAGQAVRAVRAVLAPVLPADLDPSDSQAQQWVRDELARTDYHDTRSLFERVMRWLAEKVDDLRNAQGDGTASLPPIVIALVVVAVVAAIAYLLTKVRVEQKTVAERRSLLGDSVESAATLRRLGAAALAAGRHGEAVVAYTRALARDADDRTLLSDARALTAHEVGGQLARVFPAKAARIRHAMDLFDAVAYGDLDPSREDAEAVRDTDEALRQARPDLPRTPRATSTPRGDDGSRAAGADLWSSGVRS